MYRLFSQRKAFAGNLFRRTIRAACAKKTVHKLRIIDTEVTIATKTRLERASYSTRVVGKNVIHIGRNSIPKPSFSR